MKAQKRFWLVKQEPEDFSWSNFVADGGASWTGVRNFLARNHLRGMQKDDCVLFYHSGDAKEVVGVAKVAKASYPDPTATEGDWSAVDLKPIKPFKTAVSLATIKSEPGLANIGLVKLSRLSVMPLTEAEAQRLAAMGDTTL